MAHGPTSQLEELHRFWWSFNSGHQLSQRNNFLVDPEDPGLYIRVVIVGDVVYGEDWSVFLRSSPFRPKWRKSLLEICL